MRKRLSKGFRAEISLYSDDLLPSLLCYLSLERRLLSFQMQQQQLQQQIQQQKTITSPKVVETQQATLVKQKSPEQSKSPPPKIVPGYLAVCPNCGLCSIDHYRCQRYDTFVSVRPCCKFFLLKIQTFLPSVRCRVLFKDEVKIIASAGTDQSNSGTKVKANAVPALVATDKQKNIELVQKKHQISMSEIK